MPIIQLLKKSVALCIAASTLAACVSTPFPEPNEQMDLRDRISACFIAIPTLEIFSLSGYDTVTKSRYPGQCEVWFEFEKFKRTIGLSEQRAAATGRTLEYEYDYVLDALKRIITYEPSVAVSVDGDLYRTVSSTARITGENGTLEAQAQTIWRQTPQGWVLASIEIGEVKRALDSGRIHDQNRPLPPEICRLTQGESEQTKVCRDEQGNWILVNEEI